MNHLLNIFDKRKGEFSLLKIRKEELYFQHLYYISILYIKSCPLPIHVLPQQFLFFRPKFQPSLPASLFSLPAAFYSFLCDVFHGGLMGCLFPSFFFSITSFFFSFFIFFTFKHNASHTFIYLFL